MIAHIRNYPKYTALLFIITISGCSAERAQSTGTELVDAQFPNEVIRNSSVSKNSDFFCGEVGTEQKGFRKFFSKWREKRLIFEGDGHYKVQAYADNCDIQLTDEQRAAENSHLQSLSLREAEERAVLRKEKQARDTRDEWFEKNGDAIRALHEASKIVR